MRIDPGINALYASWESAFARRDVDAVMALLTDDYVLLAPSAPPMTRDMLRPAIAAAFAKYEVAPAYEREECIVSGDLAVDHGWDVQHVRPRDGSEPRTQRSRVMLVLRRDADGAWRFARGMSQPGPAA